jgi:hypothetical protein
MLFRPLWHTVSAKWWLSCFGASGPLLQDHDGTAHCEWVKLWAGLIRFWTINLKCWCHSRHSFIFIGFFFSHYVLYIYGFLTYCLWHILELLNRAWQLYSVLPQWVDKCTGTGYLTSSSSWAFISSPGSGSSLLKYIFERQSHTVMSQYSVFQ